MRALPLAVLLLGCGAARPALYESRVDEAPLLAKLQAAGGDPSRIVVPRSIADLTPIADGERHKFALRQDGTLAIAPLPAAAPDNEYVHPILGHGPVRTAGALRVTITDGRVTAVVLDQDSKSYCPSYASLTSAVDALAALGVDRRVIRTEDRPPTCAPPRR